MFCVSSKELIKIPNNRARSFSKHTPRFSQQCSSGPTSSTCPADAAPLAHSTFLPPGGFRPRPGTAARFSSRRDLVRSQRSRNQQAVAPATTAIEMEQRVPPPLPGPNVKKLFTSVIYENSQ